MMRTPRLFNFKAFALLAIFFLGVCLELVASDDIQISDVSIETKAALRQYVLHGTVKNHSAEPREVILRGQIVFYDKAVPKGDLPVMILRKDMTLVLRASEARTANIDLLNEGAVPKGSLRLVPSLRTRRSRPWNY